MELPEGVSSKLKMGESSKMELTHPKVVASSAETLRMCVKHIAEGDLWDKACITMTIQKVTHRNEAATPGSTA